MILCDYGCGKEAKYKLKNGKLCCSKSQNSCSIIKLKNSSSLKGRKFSLEHILNLRESKRNITNETRIKLSKSKIGNNHPLYGKHHSEKSKNKIRISSKLKISYIKKKYTFFSIIEEIRYNPDKIREKEIQVHCKNHNCSNSKEQGGWFIPSRTQLRERIRQLEDKDGNGGSYFYCCDDCKQLCPLFNLKGCGINNKFIYTPSEYQTFRTFVLERDNYICQFCGEKATEVHHERPQKVEPFFALDPDYAWSCCKECHYKYGHKDECSTGNLAKKICYG